MTILRDTGVSESFILQYVLPFSSLSDTGTSVLIKGIGLKTCEWRGVGWCASFFASGYNNGK